MNIYPARIIETSHGLVLVIVVYTLLLSSSTVYALLPPIFDNEWISFLAINIILFCLMGVFYRLQHLLIKKKATAKVIRLFSLTHFNWWGKYMKNKRM